MVPFFLGVLCLVIVLLCSTYILYMHFCNRFDGEEIAGCLTLIVFLMSCHVALPEGAAG